MHRLKPLIESYLGIDPAGSGEASRWLLTWGGAAAAWRVALLGAAAALIVFMYLRETRHVGRRRWWLLALRLAALGVVALWIGELSLQVERTGLPTLVLMIDTSASMGLEDHAPQAAQRQRLQELAAEGGHDQPTRLHLAQAILLRREAALLKELERRYRLRVYEFSEGARRLTESAPRDLPALTAAIAGLQPRGSETRLAASVDQVLQEFRGSPPAAVVMLSDGISSAGAPERLSEARQPAAMQVPLFTVAIGSSEPGRDLELYDLQVDSLVFVDDTVGVEFSVRAYGLKGREADIRLRRGDGPALAQSKVSLPADGVALPVSMSFTPGEEGEYELVIEAPPLEGEIHRDNNLLRRRVQARREQIRVLLVERAPRWEYRHLKSVLERDRNVELRTVLQESDLAHQREDRTALPSFPATRDDLFAYDVVILGDVDLQYLNPGALESLRAFVGERGGGLVLIAGEQHNPTAFRGTPLEPLLPVDLSQVSRPLDVSTPFRVVPARTGADHPLLRLSDESGGWEFWQSLPPLYWCVEAPARRPGALVLATHETRETRDGRLPIIVLQRYGAGQVLYHATDELWRWRRRVGDRYYGRYWMQAVRLLCRAQLLSRPGDVELTSDRTVYRQGESVRFRLKFLDESQLPAAGEPVTVIVEREGGRRQPVVLEAALHDAAEFQGVFPSATAGSYHAWLAAPALTHSPPACDFTVEVPQRELQLRAADVADLARAAQRTGGQFLELEDAGSLPERLPRGQPVTVRSSESVALWARSELLVLFVVLLSAEWLLRKRARLI